MADSDELNLILSACIKFIFKEEIAVDDLDPPGVVPDKLTCSLSLFLSLARALYMQVANRAHLGFNFCHIHRSGDVGTYKIYAPARDSSWQVSVCAIGTSPYTHGGTDHHRCHAASSSLLYI
jgi:hypothetical protein